MATTPNGIYFEELAGSPEVSIGTEMVGAVRNFICNWSDWQVFAYELIGFWRIAGLAPIFTPPIAFPGVPLMIVSDVKIKPFMNQAPAANQYVDIGGDTNVYEIAQLTVTYKTIPFADPNNPAVPNGTYLTYEADLGAEIQTMPGRAFLWDGIADEDLALPEDMNPGIVIPTGAFTLTWDRVIAPPFDAIRSLRGKLNNAVFRNAAAGTVLFLGAESSRQFQFDPASDRGFWQMKYHFSENVKTLNDGVTQVGWNYLRWPGPGPSPNGEEWLRPIDKLGKLLYESGDLSQLFNFEIQPPTS